MRYTASDDTVMAVQTNFVDFVCSEQKLPGRIGIELKSGVAVVTPPHFRQAQGYASALNFGVVAVAINFDGRFAAETVAPEM